MNDRAKQSREEILQLIQLATAPEKMSPKEAMEFLQELAADIDGSIEALKEENEELAG